MNYPQIIPLLLGSTLISGILVAVITHYLNRRKTRAETELLRAQVNKIQTETEKVKKDLDNQSKTLIEEIEKVYHKGKYYDDFREAFVALDKCIEQFIKEGSRGHDGIIIVPLKLIGVAMTFSWDNFICHSIPNLLKKYVDVKVELEVLFVAPDYLKGFALSTHETDWVKESNERIEDVKKFCKTHGESFKKRLEFNAKIYNNLPHWHGWLVGTDHLFLGRTRWFYDNKSPRLSVGQNEYRYFSSDDTKGKERIELYLSWFYFYSQHHSQLAASTS